MGMDMGVVWRCMAWEGMGGHGMCAAWRVVSCPDVPGAWHGNVAGGRAWHGAAHSILGICRDASMKAWH